MDPEVETEDGGQKECESKFSSFTFAAPSTDPERHTEDFGQTSSANTNTPFIPEKGFYQPSTDESRSTDPERHTEDFGQTSSANTNTPFIPEKGFYQPSTDESREAYQALLSLIEYQIGERSQPIMCAIAEEILSVLKGPKLPSPNDDQQSEIRKLLKHIDNETFNQLVLVAENITDYQHVTAPAEKGFYQPRSEDTWIAYRLLLDVVKSTIPLQSLMDQCMVAHNILLALKDETIDESDAVNRKMMVEKHLDLLTDETFEMLVFIGKLIWDFDEFKIRVDTSESSQSCQMVEDDGCHGVEGFERLRIFDEDEEEGQSSDKMLVDDEVGRLC